LTSGFGTFTTRSDQPVTIQGSYFTDNTGDGTAALWIQGTGPVIVADTTITRTLALFERSHVAWAIIQFGNVGSNVLVTNSTIVNNQSGVDATDGLRLVNSIVAANNYPGPSTDFPLDVPFHDCKGEVMSLGHNLFGDPTDCGAGPTDLTGDPGVGGLVNSGRPGGGYIPLLANSRAIDAGDSTECTTSDQRGLARGIDGNGDGSRRCDIGAVEFYPTVNDRVQLEGLQYSFVKPSNLAFTDPRASAGVYRITAAFRNIGPDICHVAFDVPTLDGPAGTNPVLLTAARELLGSQGTAVPASTAGAPPHLSSGDVASYQFTIGVQQRTSINFLVNALGDATSGPCGQ
jgi:hypothetical protein